MYIELASDLDAAYVATATYEFPYFYAVARVGQSLSILRHLQEIEAAAGRTEVYSGRGSRTPPLTALAVLQGGRYRR